MAPHDEPEEPDLTAMLDLVLQLVMFFIAVAHIEKQQQNESVVLPQAGIGRSLTKDYTKVVIINAVPAGGDEPGGGKKVTYSVFEGYTTREYTDAAQVKGVLQTRFEADQKSTLPDEWAKGNGRSLIILRAHRECTFRQVYAVMTRVREVGYSDIQLRVNLPPTR